MLHKRMNLCFAVIFFFAVNLYLLKNRETSLALHELPEKLTSKQALTPQINQLYSIGRGGLIEQLWSPDGKYLLISSESGLYSYDSEEFNAEPRLLVDHRLTSLVFVLNNKTLAGVVGDNEIRIVDIETGEETTLTGEPSPGPAAHIRIMNLVFVADESLLAALYEDGSVRTWDLATKVQQNVFQIDNNFRLATFSQTGSLLLVVTDQSKIEIWRIATGLRQASLQANLRIFSLAINSDESLIGYAAPSGIYLLGIETGAEKAISEQAIADEISFSPDASHLASTNLEQGTVSIWNLETGGPELVLKGGVGLAFSSDGDLLASGNRDGQIRVWNIATGLQIAELGDYLWRVYDIALSPDGKTLFYSRADFIVCCGYIDLRRYDLETHNEKILIQRDLSAPIIKIAVSPNGKIIALANLIGDIELIEAATGLSLSSIKAHDTDIRNLFFVNEGKLLSISSYRETPNVKLWAVDQNFNMTLLQDYSLPVQNAAFDSNNDLVAFFAPVTVEQVIFWDLNTDPSASFGNLDSTPQSQSLQNAGPIIFSFDGSLLAVRDRSGNIQVWNTESRQMHTTLSDSFNFPFQIGLAFSPDMKLLAINTVLWNIDTNTLVEEFPGQNIIEHIVFDPHSNLLATSGSDAVVRVWTLGTTIE